MTNAVRNLLFGLVFLSAAGLAHADQPPYSNLIAAQARANGIPIELAHAVIRHESGYNARATGRAGEIGLMQIKLQTARGLGYRGTRKGLYDPATNLMWGMKYLGEAQRLAGGSECGTLSRYNAGLASRRIVRAIAVRSSPRGPRSGRRKRRSRLRPRWRAAASSVRF
jgi:soluble lytic murein transglycosylase-like protein